MRGAPPLAAELLQGKSFVWERNCDEKPVHKVRITRPFYGGVVKVDRCEIKHLDV
jgi:formylglycine-generating enzyme required for sulfatase activity